MVAIAARNSETGPGLAEKIGVRLTEHWEEQIGSDDIDAITVCTHNEIHGPIIVKAMEAGKHVFTEYPVGRRIEEANAISTKAAGPCPVLRVAHSENVSGTHESLKTQVADLGELLAVFFQRLTPGRGGRPEVLFNLNLTGPPALFFVYHVYAMVDLFGPAAWVESGAKYQELEDNGDYSRFINTVTVGFERGGLRQWNWAGGIKIKRAEESLTIAMEGGTLVRAQGQWQLSKPDSIVEIVPLENRITLEEQFLEDIQSGTENWKKDLNKPIALRGLVCWRSSR